VLEMMIPPQIFM
jgi:hypothetical protein